MIEINNLYNAVKKIAKEAIEYNQGIDIYTIVLVNESNYTVNIKQLNGYKNYSNVDLIGLNLGHGKGLLQLPEINDLVVVAFLKDSEKPIILGSLINRYMGQPDSVIGVKKGEFFVNNKINGAYIFIDENNNITLKNSLGSIILQYDGVIKLNGFTFPTTDGSSGQVLKTNGSKVLYFGNDNT